MKVTTDLTAGTFTLTGHSWSNTYPLADLPKWLEFYRRQRETFPRAGRAYDGTIVALEGVSRGLG